jgi:hypothetical protein
MISRARDCAFRIALLGAVSAAAALGGCASGGGSGPSGKALANGETCSSVKQQLNRLDAKGVPQWVQAQAAGRKISGQQRPTQISTTGCSTTTWARAATFDPRCRSLEPGWRPSSARARTRPYSW